MKKKYVKSLIILIIGILLCMSSTDVHAYSSKETFSATDYPNFFIKKMKGDGTGKYKRLGKITRNSDGHFVYCVQPWVDLSTDAEYDAIDNNQAATLQISGETWQRLSLIAYYGYGYQNHTDERWYGITQFMIWKAVFPQGDFFFTKTLNGERERSYDWMITEIENLIAHHYDIPNIQRDLNLTIGETITLSDSSGVLNLFDIEKSNNNVEVQKQDNSLIITATGLGDAKITLSRKNDNGLLDNTPVLYTTIAGSQDTMSRGAIDPVRIVLSTNAIGGTVGLRKKDKETQQFFPQGDASLSDALYGVYDDNSTLITTLKTITGDIAVSDILPFMGRGYIQEIKASEGYLLDSKKYYFEITPENLHPVIEVEEQVIKIEVNMFKVYANGATAVLTAEPNITFEFYLISSGELYNTKTTDSQGRFSVILPYGRYRCHQKNTSPGHETVKDFIIEVNENTENPYYKIISNAPITAKLQVIKVDKDSKKPIIREGLKFKIKNLETGEYVRQTITYPIAQTIEVYEMNKYGEIITPQPLKCGRYALEEVEDQMIDGYLWNEEPLIFEIGDDSNLIDDEEFGVLLKVEFENEQVKGELNVNKFGEKFIVENGSFRYEKIKLNNVFFDLYADGNIYSQDGTLIYQDKELVSSFHTENGGYKVTDLYLGKYCLKERATDEKHVLDSMEHCFELKYKDQKTKTVSYTLNLENYLKKADFELTKTDLITGEPVPNTFIEIYTENDELIFSGLTPEKGNILIPKLCVGRYYALERRAADGYLLTEEKLIFEIKENNEIVKVNMTNEKIVVDVPDTDLKEKPILSILGGLLILTGIGGIVYVKTKK